LFSPALEGSRIFAINKIIALRKYDLVAKLNVEEVMRINQLPADNERCRGNH
jgi:hypothetical protein